MNQQINLLLQLQQQQILLVIYHIQRQTFQVQILKVQQEHFISTGISSVMTVTGTDDGSGEELDIVIKRNSGNPADDDILGALVFKGENDAT